ncbi:uncharacterized membrane protein HdeD (DUF308 family) [Murinocardiopsis flavida]|uniref:Uncharacterized membrane protein HdeD (DUF308 family) n=1 Tax=Murinocardiopsis flavida TaxID=645275 RepID=A0A2P8DQS1_9ACTN|nr:HdeD family acid-resistance protein [Murinocardiopsis flavida]PSK99550.1 uncharacterized membrane protein HdeD (DUF308 family) [Murinocardiopsis flavida]
MLAVLARHWWALVIRGAAAVLFGVLALVWPDLTLIALVILVGAFALVDGVFLLVHTFSGERSGSRWLPAVQAVVSIVFGLLVLFWPELSALTLALLIGAWALVGGVVQIASGIRLRKEITNEWLLVLSGALSVLFGLVMLVAPGAGALALVWVIGIYAIILGIALIILGVRLRGRVGTQDAAATTDTTPV